MWIVLRFSQKAVYFLIKTRRWNFIFCFKFIYFIIILLFTGGTLWDLQKCLQYILVELLLSNILLYPSSPPIPRIVSTDLTFPFSYMSTQYFYHIHPLTPFPYILPLPLVTTLQTGPVLLIALFCPYTPTFSCPPTLPHPFSYHCLFLNFINIWCILICLFESGLLCLISWPLIPSIFQQMTKFHSFLWLNKTPLSL
jgi:hypothetical protein